MPIIRDTDGFAGEDQKKYHYNPQAKKDNKEGGASNATGAILDIDYQGNEWRSKIDQNESEYTRIRMREENDADQVHLRTRYLFDEDQAMTPLSQMQQTKNMLTEAQRVAYVGLCALVSTEMVKKLKRLTGKESKSSIQNMELWRLKILGRLYYHMELATAEQKMVENLADHGVQPSDLVPALMTTHTVANPEYDPIEAQRQADLQKEEAEASSESDDISEVTMVEPTTTSPTVPLQSPGSSKSEVFQTTSRVLETTSTAAVPGVSTSLSTVDENVTLDIRWTVLCDLFLVLIADSVYDARSRVLLEMVAIYLGFGWLDVVKFEQRVTEALEIQEDVENMEQREIIVDRQKSSRRRRYMMVGLATLGGGLVIGLSAGLLAPVIGAGLGAAFTTIGISGTAGFLGGAGGAAVITTGGVLTGSSIAARGMARRTRVVRTFDVLPLHNNKRVNCIITVPGFLNGELDDPRLPFSVLDPVVGDVFSVLWEPEMIRETGGALRIMTAEILSQIGQTVLAATAMTALMTALQWPIILTKLGYLIDNPWNNALDRAKAAGSVLADILVQRHLGVRPITLIGFSLGARVIFYALLELAKQKAFGIVQDVFLLGATLTASQKNWLQARSIVSGRFVNGFARNDWVLNYLFRATSGGVGTVAGLRPVENVPGLENVDVTDKISGHISYRTFMPLILDQLGFPVSVDHFDEPEEPDFEEDRIVVQEGEEVPRKGWFSKSKPSAPNGSTSRPPSATSFGQAQKPKVQAGEAKDDGDLPPREVKTPTVSTPSSPQPATGQEQRPNDSTGDSAGELPTHAGFNLAAMKAVIEDITVSGPPLSEIPHPHPAERPQSTTPPAVNTPDLRPISMRSSGAHNPTMDGLTDDMSAPAKSVDVRDTSPFASEDGEEDLTGRLSSSRSPSTYHSRTAAGPTLSFAGDDGTPRTPVVADRDMIGGFGTSFGNPFRSTTFAAVGSTGSSSNASNASIVASITDRDPWSFQTYSGDVSDGRNAKKPPLFAVNPWES
ncbi:hypothetical protein B0F90DRAFT_1738079 [Multifurca ochricompacta]|uniref:DUF726-domain-containing protein n=1 Tax=Multifurca ochricompacta TaxID=376703 RepID=A0AAD4QLX0_9AGAM|nr:hypothetical protein B0F90DRAFT_1738079 [Multifurca ochricompacta]